MIKRLFFKVKPQVQHPQNYVPCFANQLSPTAPNNFKKSPNQNGSNFQMPTGITNMGTGKGNDFLKFLENIFFLKFHMLAHLCNNFFLQKRRNNLKRIKMLVDVHLLQKKILELQLILSKKFFFNF